MANPLKGKLYFLCFLLVFCLPPLPVFVSSSSKSVSDQTELEPSRLRESETGSGVSSYQQQALLSKLEELVKNLSDVVSLLESKLSEPLTVASAEKKQRVEDSKLRVKEIRDSIERKHDETDGVEDGSLEAEKVRGGERTPATSVTKYSAFWSERFQFISAVKLDSDVTCINLLPFRDFEGLSKYVAVGDERGRVYVFLRNGDVLVEFYTISESPITSILSYMSVYKNESFLVTGHKNGAILMHRLWEGSNGEEWNLLFMEHVSEFVSEQLPLSILEVHHVGRIRYILSVDLSGKIVVFRENGTIHGSIMPTSRPLTFLKQRMMFLTEKGAGSLDLRSMKLREAECEGLNHSLARSYMFDAVERSKAYGFTSTGDLIQVLLLGDVMNFKCRVRSKRKLDIDEPMRVEAIKGYLLVIGKEKVLVYNVSSQHYVRVGSPRLLFSAGLDEIKSSFLNNQNVEVDSERLVIPLIVSDREKLVVLGLGGGYVGMFRSNLQVFRGEINTMLWTSPVLFFILFLWGAWQFFAKKKEALTSWGPDDPFSSSTSATSGAPLGTGSSDRSFLETSSRSTNVMDLRGGGGLRGPSIYPSGAPTRYPGGATSSYRPGSTDLNTSRSAAVDPKFRATSELKFRGSTLESPAFPKRMEPLFGNTQVVDESAER